MALLQISEPGTNSEPHKHKIAIGIDLGTTNSLVATIKSSMPTVLDNEKNQKLIPSAVYYAANGEIKVGQDATDQLITDPANTILSAKRLLGKDFNEIKLSSKLPYNFVEKDNMVMIKTAHGDKSPVQVSADILYKLKQLAITSLGEEPTGVVVTVPAYFNESQRQATKQAANIAGLQLLRLLNEPTAAAIAYGLDNRTSDGTFLVYDLGGGTLDVSVLKFNKGIFQVLAVNGDTNLGGDDFDHLICNHFIAKNNLTDLTQADIATLISSSKFLKEQLTDKDIASCSIKLHKNNVNLSISKQEFNDITQTLVNKTLLPIKKALRDAKLNINDIDEVIMVGGSTRMPNIQEAVSNLFNQKKLLSNIDPDLVVAIGAAIQADILVGNQKDDWLLLDVTPLSLGIETMGGLTEKIIQRNSTIPIVVAQEFTTHKDGQTAMSVHVVQGERELASECRSLAKFSLKGIPPMAAGTARIRITFQIDADGLLSVSAKEQTTGIESSISVKPSFGLAEDQIQHMLSDSVKHAQTDIKARVLSEAINDATSLINMLNKALEDDGDLLSEQQKNTLTNIMANLNQAIEQTQLELITALTKELEIQAEPFAAARTNRALAKNLSGKKIDEVKSLLS